MSNEWFERGVHDAQNDQLNTTYYQHYYYYRIGYDHARRQLRKPAASVVQPRSRMLLLAGLLLLVAAGIYLWRQPRSLPTGDISAVGVAATAQPTPEPTITPAPTVEPSPEPLTLRPEGFAQIVNTNGAPLRARAEPSRAARIEARLPEGSRIKLVEGPIEADGYIWWRVEGEAGSGWVAQGEPGGAPWIEPIP